MSLSFIKTNDDRWTVVINGERPYSFGVDHSRYDDLVKAVVNGNVEEFKQLMITAERIKNWSENGFVVKDGCLFFHGEEVAKEPSRRLIECLQNGFPHQPITNYLTRLYENVSSRAVQESYSWCANKGIPITSEGMLVGYKGVKYYNGPNIPCLNGELKSGDLVDIYTGVSYRNNIGDTCSMPRRKVCDDHLHGCAEGLHVGTYEYALNWAGTQGVVVLVQFDPKNIVSVPSDHNCQKMRVSEYSVVGIAPKEVIAEPVFDPGSPE